MNTENLFFMIKVVVIILLLLMVGFILFFIGIIFYSLNQLRKTQGWYKAATELLSLLLLFAAFIFFNANIAK